jgi:hypothetical protein
MTVEELDAETGGNAILTALQEKVLKAIGVDGGLHDGLVTRVNDCLAWCNSGQKQEKWVKHVEETSRAIASGSSSDPAQSMRVAVSEAGSASTHANQMSKFYRGHAPGLFLHEHVAVTTASVEYWTELE